MSEKEFFRVISLEDALKHIASLPVLSHEVISLDESPGRVLAEDIVSGIDLPQFRRAAMDGFAVQARSTFGASESIPALLTVVGHVNMGEAPSMAVGLMEAVRIGTGGMVPQGADSVVMLEHTQWLDQNTIEVTRSVAPLQHVMEVGDDFRKGETVLSKGQAVRPQEMGVLAALGRSSVKVFKRPKVAVISSGDEIVPVDKTPTLSQIRDVNAYTLAGLVRLSGGDPWYLGIAGDSLDDLNRYCRDALAAADMVLVSGGSSVGARDFTLEMIQGLPDGEIVFHGVAVSPGKPTILARSGIKAIWGLPGQVTSAMVVFHILVRPALERIGGFNRAGGPREFPALLGRNLASVHGREDFVRVRLARRDGEVWAEPILGKSGLIHTMVKADGFVRIARNSEGLERGTPVGVILF